MCCCLPLCQAPSQRDLTQVPAWQQCGVSGVPQHHPSLPCRLCSQLQREESEWLLALICAVHAFSRRHAVLQVSDDGLDDEARLQPFLSLSPRHARFVSLSARAAALTADSLSRCRVPEAVATSLVASCASGRASPTLCP